MIEDTAHQALLDLEHSLIQMDAARQQQHRAAYDWARDQAELRKVECQLGALAAKKRKRVKA